MKNGRIMGPKNNISFDSASGIFETEEQYFAVKAGRWADGKFDGSTPERAASNASEILQYKPNASDGFYWIRRVNNTPIEVYCDMTRDGGGWMLLNGSNSSVSVNKGSASWGGDFLNVGIQESGCGSNPLSYRLTNIPFEAWSESRLLMRRISTIAQCSGITYDGGSKTFSGYYNTTTSTDAAMEQYPGVSGSVSRGTCGWGDGIWTISTNNNSVSGLKNFWVFTASGTKITPTHKTECSPGSGSHTHKWYIK